MNHKFPDDAEHLYINKEYKIEFEGIANFIKNQYNEAASTSIKRWAADFMDEVSCTICKGSRLKKEALFFKINEKNIAELN